MFKGNVATGEGGLHFLEEEEIIPVILEISEQSPVLSVRGYVDRHCPHLNNVSDVF